MKTLKIFAMFLTLAFLASCGSAFKSQVGNTQSNEPYWRSWNKANNVSGPALKLKKYFAERLKEGSRNDGNKDFYLDVQGKTIGFIKDGVNFRIKEGMGSGTVQTKQNGQTVNEFKTFNILHISFSPSPGCAYPEQGEIIIEFASDYCYDCITAYYTPGNVNALGKIQFADANLRNFWEKVFGSLQQQVEDDIHESTTPIKYATMSH